MKDHNIDIAFTIERLPEIKNQPETRSAKNPNLPVQETIREAPQHFSNT